MTRGSLLLDEGPAVRIYFLVLLATAILLWWVPGTPSLLPYFQSLDFWLLLVMAGLFEGVFAIRLPSGGRLTASFLVLFVALLLMEAHVAAFLAMLSNAFGTVIIQKRHASVALFNGAQYTLSYLAAGWAMQALAQGEPLLRLPLSNFLVVTFVGSMAYLAASSLIVNGYLAFKHRIPMWRLFWEEDRWELLLVVMGWLVVALVIQLHATNGWLSTPALFGVTLLLLFSVKSHIQTREAKREVEAHNKSLNELYDMVNRIGNRQTQPQIWSTLIRELPDLIPYDRCLIFRLDHAKSQLALQATDLVGGPDERYDLLTVDPPLHWAIALRETVIDNQFQAPESYDEAWQSYRSVLAGPVLWHPHNEVGWVITLLHREPHVYDKHHRQLLRLLITQVETSIRKVRLYEETQQQAIRDGLTGLFNHRYFKAQIENELRRASRYRYPTSLILTDVDYFKRFNDTHGHLLGDAVLKEVGQILLEAVRETDVVARYGGEEFALLLPETTLEQATEVAERIRAKISQHPFVGKHGQKVPITASMGVAFCYQDDMDMARFINLADGALYRAKHLGRNQICQAEPMHDEIPVVPAAVPQGPKLAVPDPGTLSEWADHFRARQEELVSAWQEELQKRGQHPAEPRADLAEAITLLLSERLILLATRPDQMDYPFHGPHVETLRLAALRQLPSRNALVRFLETLLLLQEVVHRKSPVDHPFLHTLINYLFTSLILMVLEAWLDHFATSNQQLLQVANVERELSYAVDTDDLLKAALTCLKQDLACPTVLGLVREGNRLILEQALGAPTPPTLPQSWLIGQSPFEAWLKLDEPSVVDVPGDVSAWLTEGQALIIPLRGDRRPRGLLIGSLPPQSDISALTLRVAEGIGWQTAQALERFSREETLYFSGTQVLMDLIDGWEGDDAHSRRVADVCRLLGEASGLIGSDLRQLVVAGHLHDLGKLGHSRDGSHAIASGGLLAPYGEIALMVRHHHERYDGTGLPSGLKADTIPLGARLIAVANAYCHQAPPQATPEACLAAVAVLRSQSGAYDPQCLSWLESLAVHGLP